MLTCLVTTGQTVSDILDNSLKSQLVRLVLETPFALLVVTEGPPVTFQVDISKDGVKLPEKRVTLPNVFLFLLPLESPGAQSVSLLLTVRSLAGLSVELPVVGKTSL